MALIPTWRRLHRWHGLVVSVIVLASAGSGLIHTWMSRTQSPPPAARPGVGLSASAAVLAPATVALSLPATAGAVLSMDLRPLGGEPWYRISAQGQRAPLWISAVDGRPDPGADARYAARIASAHLGGATVRQSGFLTAYDDEYIAIFRILPVYRFHADDSKGTRVYVSTMTGSVTRLTDDRKQWEANVFSLFHKWTFLTSKDARDWGLMIAMAAIIALALSGIGLFWATRKR